MFQCFNDEFASIYSVEVAHNPCAGGVQVIIGTSFKMEVVLGGYSGGGVGGDVGRW